MPRQFFIILSLLVIATVGTIVLVKQKRFREEPQTFQKVTPFELTSSDNKKVTLKDLEGKVWVANFIFTSCGDFCPALTRQMRLIQKHVGDNDHIRLVSFSVDPETDTPQVLAEYAKEYNADTSRWYFLTGKESDIKKLMVEGFKIGFADDPVYHSDRFVLVDEKGFVRGYYSHKDPRDMKGLQMDLKSLSEKE